MLYEVITPNSGSGNSRQYFFPSLQSQKLLFILYNILECFIFNEFSLDFSELTNILGKIRVEVF